MKTTIKFITLVLMAMAMTITSCSKDETEGPIGPQGPQGEQGIQGQEGAEGPAGQDGTNGEDGNANVITSPWIPEEFSATPDSYSDFTYSDPDLTAEITDNAAILVYGKATTGVIVGLPIVFSNQTYYYVINISLNQMIFVGETIDNSDILFTTFDAFRYVIIPDGEDSTSKSGRPDFSKMSYEEVMDYFALEY